MRKTCIKCGHVNPEASGDIVEACPKCGVIYAKAEAAMLKPVARPERVSELPSMPAPLPPRSTYHEPVPFIDQLRSESLYPSFRSVVSLLYWLGVVAAGCVLVGSLYALIAQGNIVAGAMGTAFAIFIFVMSKAGKEASLMIADMSDATVRMAQRQEGT